MTHRTCAQLGICQNRRPACNGCNAEQAAIDAEREAADRAMADAMRPLSLLEELFAWGAIALATVACVALVMAVAGYRLGLHQ